MVKVPLSNSFLERRDARRKFSESLGAGASLAPRTRQRISLQSENDWKFRLRSCQSWKASSLSLGVVVLTYRRFTRRADRRLPPGCYGNLIVNVKRGQSRPKRACGVGPDRHDWATFTFTVIAEVRSCCTEMTKES